MPPIEISVPASVDAEIDRFIDEGEFVNRQQAIEALLATGLSAYGPTDEPPAAMTDDVFIQAEADQVDPAIDDTSENDDFPA